MTTEPIPAQQFPNPAPVKVSRTAPPAARVAGTIGIVKWLVVAFGIISTLVSFAVLVTSDTDAFAQAMALLVLAGGVVTVLVVWVLFGWFQHTLGALAEIAANTSAGAR